MALDEKKLEEERKKRALESDRKIFGEYFEKVRMISQKIQQALPQSFCVQEKTVIGISRLQNEEPRLVCLDSQSIPFSKVDFNSL